MLRDTTYDLTERIVGWTTVYGLNILVPAFYGSLVCKGGGLVGMIAGIFAFYAVATYFVVRFPHFGTATIRGAALFGFTQMLFVLHIWAGTLAVGIWNTLFGGSARDLGGGNPVLAEVGGFACTIMTGQPLFAIAVGLGYILNAIGDAITGGRPSEAELSDHE